MSIGRTYLLNGIAFNPVDANGIMVPDSNGVFWYADDLLGWDAGGDLRVTTAPRMGPGDVLEEGELSGLLLTLTGVTVGAPSEAARYAAIRQYQAATRLRKQEAALLVVGEDIVRQVSVVRASGKADVVMVPRPGSVTAFTASPLADGNDIWWLFRSQVPLLAPDPKRYSFIQQSSAVAAGIVVCHNAGNFPAPWSAVITGGTTGDVLTVNGKSITLSNAVEAIPHPLNLDSNIHSVTDGGGASAFGAILNGYAWGYLDPGDTGVNYTGSGTCNLFWRDTWA